MPKIYSFSDGLDSLGAPEWLVANHIDTGTLAALVAAPSQGKSFVALDVACCVATGTDWHGNATKRGHVVYLAGEGVRGVYTRTLAWLKAHNVHPDDLDMSLMHGGTQLHDPTVLQSLKLQLASLPSPPALIVIDTLSRYISGMDENSNTEMGMFIAALNDLQATFGCTILLVHHVSKSSGLARGASALVGALDWLYTIHKDDEPSDTPMSLTISCDKSKDFSPPAPISLIGSLVDVVLPGTDEVGNSLVFSRATTNIEHVLRSCLTAGRRSLLAAIASDVISAGNKPLARRDCSVSTEGRSTDLSAHIHPTVVEVLHLAALEPTHEYSWASLVDNIRLAPELFTEDI